MSTINLEHHFVTVAHEQSVFQGVNSFQDLMSAINRSAAKIIPDPEDRNTFKGDAFEMFGEYLIKANPHPKIRITDYRPNDDEDMGVDGLGTGPDDLPAAIQFKFRSNPKDLLTYKDLSTFGNDALANYGIVSQGEAKRKNELFGKMVKDGTISEEQARNLGFPFKHGMKNMVVIATTLEAYYTWELVNQESRFIGYEDLTYFTKNNPQFWEGFKDSIRDSAIRAVERTPRTLNKPQQEAVVRVEEFLDSDIPRAQVIMPTGSGKTTVAHEAIERVTQGSGKICIYISPRIALTMQNMNEFWDLKRTSWTPIPVCSGPGEVLEYYAGETFAKVNPTTQCSDIIRAVQSTERGENVVFFVTNHSVLKIGRVLKEQGREADIVIGDEAHNLTAHGFKEALESDNLPTKKWLFLTATRKVGYSDEGRGMNNSEKFGKVIYSTSPANLIREGIIVPPRIHWAKLDTPLQILQEEEISIKDQLGLVIGGIKKHAEMMAERGNPSARVIVFCQSAIDAHEFAKSETILKYLPEFYIEAITSYRAKMEGKKRKDIFNRFKDSEKAILFHYDVISEGIDLPGATGIFPLRGLGPIKATQGIGRVLRVTEEDRESLREGKIVPGDPEGWSKPYGWIILPEVSETNEDNHERIKSVVHALRSEDYGIDVEQMVVVDNPKGRNISPPEDLDTAEERHEFHDLFDLPELLSKIIHICESEDTVRYCGFIEAQDWARSLGLSNWLEWQNLEPDRLRWDIPPNPEEVYADLGWRGPKNWLGF